MAVFDGNGCAQGAFLRNLRKSLNSNTSSFSTVAQPLCSLIHCTTRFQPEHHGEEPPIDSTQHRDESVSADHSRQVKLATTGPVAGLCPLAQCRLVRDIVPAGESVVPHPSCLSAGTIKDNFLVVLSFFNNKYIFSAGLTSAQSCWIWALVAGALPGSRSDSR